MRPRPSDEHDSRRCSVPTERDKSTLVVSLYLLIEQQWEQDKHQFLVSREPFTYRAGSREPQPMPTRLWAGSFSPPPAMCASCAVRCSSPNPDRKGEKQAPGMEQSRVAKNRVYKTVEGRPPADKERLAIWAGSAGIPLGIRWSGLSR